MRTYLLFVVFSVLCFTGLTPAKAAEASKLADKTIVFSIVKDQSFEGQTRRRANKILRGRKINATMEKLVAQCPSLRSMTAFHGDTVSISFDAEGNIASATLTLRNKKVAPIDLDVREKVGADAPKVPAVEPTTPKAVDPTPEPEPVKAPVAPVGAIAATPLMPAEVIPPAAKQTTLAPVKAETPFITIEGVKVTAIDFAVLADKLTLKSAANPKAKLQSFLSATEKALMAKADPLQTAGFLNANKELVGGEENVAILLKAATEQEDPLSEVDFTKPPIELVPEPEEALAEEKVATQVVTLPPQVKSPTSPWRLPAAILIGLLILVLVVVALGLRPRRKKNGPAQDEPKTTPGPKPENIQPDDEDRVKKPDTVVVASPEEQRMRHITFMVNMGSTSWVSEDGKLSLEEIAFLEKKIADKGEEFVDASVINYLMEQRQLNGLSPRAEVPTEQA